MADLIWFEVADAIWLAAQPGFHELPQASSGALADRAAGAHPAGTAPQVLPPGGRAAGGTGGTAGGTAGGDFAAPDLADDLAAEYATGSPQLAARWNALAVASARMGTQQAEPDAPHTAPAALPAPWAGPLPRGRLAGTRSPVHAATIGRALRPLKQLTPSREDVALDEEATAELIAAGELSPLVSRPALELKWDLALVLDDSLSMTIWRDTCRAFARVLERQGAFRTIRVFQMATSVTAANQLCLRSPGPGLGAHGPAELLDTTGQRIMLVLTDGLSSGWHSGAVLVQLRAWARTLPLAVIQMLPQRLWHRTGLRPELVRLLARAPGTPTADLRWERRGGWPLAAEDAPELTQDQVVPVPVLEMRSRWLEPWAKLVGGAGTGWTNLSAALTGPPGTSHRTGPADVPTTQEQETTPRSPLDQVLGFRAVASPTAFKLALHLAAAPLNLPVIKAVQKAMLPRSSPSHLAELFMSGLLQLTGPAEQADNPEKVTFDFTQGVREELLSVARRGDTTRVMRAVERYLSPRVAAVRGMSNLLETPDSAWSIPVTDETEPFLKVQQRVLEALSGRYLIPAQQLQKAIDERLWTEQPQALPQPGKNIYSRGEKVPSAPAESAAHSATSAQPGSPPAVWGNIPPRNPNFTGRQQLLANLHVRLQSGTTAVLPEALHGMGGVGKSQLAIEYVYRHLTEYDLVWWIPAERSAQVAQALVELAQRLDLPTGTEANTAVPMIMEALRTGKPHSKWLLIFDNAESPATVRNYFPTGGHGRILITSRNPQWASIAHPLEVDVFTRDESKQLLMRRGPDLADTDANGLAEALGDLPLAIEQAAAWRAETGMPADEYLRLFREKRTELLKVSPPMDYQLPVAAAWNVSLDQLEVQNPAALQLLQVCSFFAPEPIPRTLLSGPRRISIMPELDTALRDPIRLSRSIREISRYALARINYRTNSIMMHRLVQTVLVERMTNEEKREEMRHNAHILLAAGDPGEPSSSTSWPRYAELYPHVVESDAIHSNDPWVRELVLNTARYLYYWGDHEGAREFSQRAYDAWRELLGEENQHTLAIGQWLGFMLFVVGQYDAAAVHNSHILDVYQRLVPEDREDALDALGAVAADRRAHGDFAGALELSQTIYERAVRSFGEEDPTTINHAHNLGVSMRLVGKFQEARVIDEQTFQLRAQIFGADHEATLNSQGALTIDVRELGDYVGARIAQEEIVGKLRQLMGEVNPATIRATRLLAVTRRKAGDHAGARELSEDARARFASRYGQDHPDTLASALNLSVDLRQTGDLAGARELGERASARYAATLGRDHPHALSADVNLAITLRLLGAPETAREIDERVLVGFRQRLGDDHVLTLVCATNLASDMAALGQHKAAYELGMDTLERSRSLLGDEHPSTLALAANVSADLASLGGGAEASALLEDTLARFRSTLGEEHPATVAAIARVRANADIDPMAF